MNEAGLLLRLDHRVRSAVTGAARDGRSAPRLALSGVGEVRRRVLDGLVDCFDGVVQRRSLVSSRRSGCERGQREAGPCDGLETTASCDGSRRSRMRPPSRTDDHGTPSFSRTIDNDETEDRPRRRAVRLRCRHRRRPSARRQRSESRRHRRPGHVLVGYPNRTTERQPSCGIGAELVLVMPLLGLAARRRRGSCPAPEFA